MARSNGRTWQLHVMLTMIFAGFLHPPPVLAEGPDTSPGLDGLSILYKLDAGVMGVSYGRRWLAGPVFRSAVQAGTMATVNVKVRGMDVRRDPVPVTPEWTVVDEAMIEVTAGRDNEFRITVKQAGESRLVVAAQGYSLELLVKAQDLGEAMQVEISELGSKRPVREDDPGGQVRAAR